MICPACLARFDTLICPGCAEAKSRTAYREYQMHPLREVAAERVKVVARAVDTSKSHLQMFGCAKTFCWVGVETHWRKRELSLEQLTEAASLDRICPLCYEVFTTLITEAIPCSM